MGVEPGNKSVLIVDDDPIQLEYYIAVLEFDYEIITAGSFSEALQILSSDVTVDAMTCDQHLDGGHTGTELLDHVAICRPGLLAHTVLVSGDYFTHAGEHLAPIVLKPVEPDQLLQVIGQIMTPGNLAVAC
ncbi:response regulator [Mariprofundus erugo]|uniref:response regulator n=1 Tax=Mariprofundus erugo TaxID=2528639 RepID=UPI0010FD6B22|nr:response regulator [Mariprofundus erugo]TLS76232.1 response regulator [Mariprofundus erugo]